MVFNIIYIYIYIYIFLCHVYVVKQVALFWGPGQLMGIVHNKCALEEESCLLVMWKVELLAVLPEIYS